MERKLAIGVKFVVTGVKPGWTMEDVTIGKVYEIAGHDLDGSPYFIDDVGDDDYAVDDISDNGVATYEIFRGDSIKDIRGNDVFAGDYIAYAYTGFRTLKLSVFQVLEVMPVTKIVKVRSVDGTPAGCLGNVAELGFKIEGFKENVAT